MREVLGNPYVHYHLNYLDISFQAKLKSKGRSGKCILWEARYAAAQDRSWTRQAIELCDGGMLGKSVKAGNVPSKSISVSNTGGNHTAFP